MNAFSKIDMTEALRLTRAGKLAEAAALLQGRAASGAGDERPTTPPLPRLPPVDMASTKRRPPADSSAPNMAATLTGFTQTMQAFRSREPKRPSFSGLTESGARSVVATPEGARFEERIFANGAGSRTYKVYVPSGYKGQALPVVIMLHGCTQNPDDFAAGTRMNELAEEQTFLVAYPHQPKSANMQKCWNWFDAENQQRDRGEPLLIAGLARQIVEEFSADANRVYVAGLSAGGAAAAVLAATYPDVFAAVGVHSGLACGAAKDMPSAFAAMAGNGAIRSKGVGAIVPTIVFHGDADRTVHLANAEQIVEQASSETTLSKVVTRGETADGVAYTRIVQLDDASAEVVEQWVLHGAGHAWSGGSVNGTFTDPRGPDASREMMRFFLQHAIGGAGRKS